jgi:transcriptional regulator with XRE-family HTH domain
MSEDTITIGQRVRRLRKLRGLSQKEFARRARLSLRTVTTVEQDAAPVRIATLRSMAEALRVETRDLQSPGVPEQGDPMPGVPWEDVRDALYRPERGDGEPVPEREVLAALRSSMPALAANRYAEVRAALPDLIRDASGLGEDGRTAQSRVLNATAWLLTQTRQWEDAMTAGRRALDAAADRGDKLAAANTLCWCLLRQGRLGEAGDLAVEWADLTEPRISSAAVADLAGWGKLWLYVANAKIRNNEPGAAADALRIAAAAAARIGREVHADASTTRTFGPVTVPMIRAENAVLAGRPDVALAIAGRIPAGGLLHAQSASVLRHRLDVAAAHSQLRDYGRAVEVMSGLRGQAPEWLAQQRYARDVLEGIIRRRRTLSAEMRELAAAVRLDL